MLRILFFICLLVSACSPGKPESASSSAPAPSNLPLFSARMLDSGGAMVALDRWRGKPLLVNFWARWCEPCRAEIPEIDAIASAWQARGLSVIGVALEQDPNAVRDFASQLGMRYPALLSGDKGYALMEAMGNRSQAIPFTVAIDRNGRIVGSKLGRISRSEVEALAEAAVATP